jgi:hypothetical protein
VRRTGQSVWARLFAAALIATAAAAVAAGSLAAGGPTSRASYVANPPFARIASVGTAAAAAPAQCHPGFNCYSPADMRAVYDIPSGPGADGSGQTIIVVVAYGSRTIASDLATFDSAFSLPDPSLSILGPNGSGNQNDQVVVGWTFETSLDVEWAHAIAPAANIVLAVAPSADSHAINHALARVIPAYPGAVIAQSFGTDETFARDGFIDDKSAHKLYASAAALGDTVLAGTGDFGASGIGDTAIVASYPASDPLVTAVGGTEGFPGVNDLWRLNSKTGTGGYGGEQAWNETFPFPGATGGAPSQIFPAPAYQAAQGAAKRTVPDVSYNASVAAGVIGIVQGSPAIFGGTSAGTPQWAGIFAIANEQRAAAAEGPLGPANPVLYAHAGDLHDITAGNNIFDPSIGGFTAGPGYDLATGLGTPDAGALLKDLLAAPGAPGAGKLPDTTCQNQQLSGAYHDVEVRAGSWCDLANATVTGSVEADKASGLGITGSTIVGGIEAQRTSAALDPSHSGLNVVCNSVVFGNAEIVNSSPSSPWSVGGAGCVADVTGSVGNVVGNDLRFNRNAAPGNDVSNNTVDRNLECQRNAGLAGGANLVGGTSQGACGSAPLPG